ncbi:MAG: NADH-quinone oxidoreductase subunit N, partial [Actinobacteria bacterium]|nr:NADH-quinone oxidoreductase subunit N [Actinomycetota bacterium]
MNFLLAMGTHAFRAPHLDYKALAPEIVLTGVLLVILVVDLLVDETNKVVVTNLAGLGVLGALIPVVLLGASGHHSSMFGGAYVVDNFALVFKGLFLASAYIVLLMAAHYLEEGDYYEGEFSFLLLSSVLGMVVMGSARDLISIFVALELLSIPAYLLAGWRKRDLKSNEASLKYYLLGVLASAVMLYGMSLVFGVTGTTVLASIRENLNQFQHIPGVVVIGIFFI